MTLMESIGNALGRMTQALQRPRSPNTFSPVGAVEKPGHQDIFVGQDPWLSGGLPLTPKDPDGTPPRRWQYPPGFNIQISPRSTEAINFAQLRGLAEYTIVRVIIEHLKTSLQAHEWDIVSTNREDENNYEPDITEVKRFLEKPDGEHEWIEWLNEVIEERLVTDAVTIYPRMTYGGKLASLDLIDGSCFTDDAEILTKNGWKRFQDLDKENDVVATRSPSGKLEWQKPTYFHEKRYRGPLVKFKSRTLDLLVTPNHRMLFSHTGEDKLRIKTAKELVGQSKKSLPVTARWGGEMPGEKDNPGGMGVMDWSAFIGLFLAEGSTAKADNSKQVWISQKRDSRHWDKIDSLLSRTPWKWKYYESNQAWGTWNQNLHGYLVELGGSTTKYVPQWLKDAPPRYQAVAWRWYVYGDGNAESTKEDVSAAASGNCLVLRGHRTRHRAYTSSKRMADDWQEILLKIGRSASVSEQQMKTVWLKDHYVVPSGPGYIIGERKSKTLTVAATPGPDYDGMIYCVSVPNEIIYVRRNGKPVWTGNTIKVLCDTRGFLPMSPYPAYQQFLYGVPKTWYTQEELMYLPGNRRVNKFYGFSPTEQLVITINQGIRRELYNLAAWTDGNTPAGIATLPKEWGLEKIRQFAEYFDELLRGNAQQRSKIFWAPEGSSLQKFKEEESYNLHNKFDEWVARVCCFAYGVSPIPFISMTNRSVAEELGDVEAEGGAAALKMYIERVMNKIIKKYMGKPWLSWNWITDRGRTQAKIVESNKAKVMCGVMQVDEWRIEEGKKPLGLPPGYPTPSGYVLFPEKPKEAPLEPQVQQPVAEDNRTVVTPPVLARSATALKKMRNIELDKYERWALKRGEEDKPRRGFKPEFLGEDEVEEIEQEINWEDEDDLDQDMENVVRDRIKRVFQSRRNGGKKAAPGRKG